jgi:uncharacterized protein YdaU (DUF1376 family)
LEHGAYLLLIMDYWRNGGLPDNDEILARIAGLTVKEWGRARASIAPLFHDGWKHKRIDRELAEAASRSDSARKSAEERWKNHRNANASAAAERSDVRTHSDGNTEPMLSQPQSQEESSLCSESRATDEAFGRFWAVWPNKVGKPAARRAFGKLAHEIEAIIAGVERYAREKPPDRPWLNPATFLNQRRWEDQPAKLAPRAGPTGQTAPTSNPEKSVHAAARKLCEDVANGIVTIGPKPKPISELLFGFGERERDDHPRLLSQRGS